MQFLFIDMGSAFLFTTTNMSSGAYFCRSCKLPLVIDESLEELSHAQQHLLTLNYGEKPPSSIIRNDSTLSIKNTTGGKENFSNLYDEYPKIPDSRMNVFQEALESSQYKGVSKSESYTDDNDLSDSKATSGDNRNSESSFVYLHDKAQTDDDIYGNNGTSSMISNSSNSVKPFKMEEIKDVIEKKSDISERIESLDTIFNIISSKYEIDYPVCSDCATTLIDQMKSKYNTLNKEKEMYIQFLKKLTAQNGPNVEKTKKALRDLDEMKEKEQEVLKQLSEEEQRHLELNKELRELEDDIKKLEAEEYELCLNKNKQEMEIEKNLLELNTVKNKYYQNLDFLDSLRKTNVFNNFFDISNEGKFGTINGLRLGCLDDIKVTWHEINAALGQLVLLLSTCLNILALDLKEYKLIPMGSTSKIEKYETESSGAVSKSIIQLYCTGEFSIGGFFSHNNLDVGMVCLVEILNQIGARIKELDSSCQLPYAMVGDKVAGFCIRPSGRSGWESWTNGCRFLLINVKWILTFCVSYYEDRARSK